jgi:DNA repair protein RecO (recombination protein O)
MAQLRDDVFVIKSIDYAEADKILTLFGRRTGKFAVIAKGIRKIASKNRGNLQTLSLSNVGYFEGKNLSVLRDSELILEFDSKSSSMQIAKRLLILLNKLLPDSHPEPEIFDSLANLMKDFYVNGCEESRLNKFRFTYLARLGFLPNTKECILTGVTTDLDYFDPKTLGVVSVQAVKAGLVNPSFLWEKRGLDYGQAKVTDAIDEFIKRLIG